MDKLQNSEKLQDNSLFRGVDMVPFLRSKAGRRFKGFVVAIDGPCASGKGTLAKLLAHRLGYSALDTGALYRLIAKTALDRGSDIDDEKSISGIAIEIAQNPDFNLLNDKALRADAVGSAASKIAPYPAVRSALLMMQRDFAKNPPALDGELEPLGSVLDGRDIGTVVCPDADVKLYITADLDERAKRRVKQLQSLDDSVTYETVFSDMRERDSRDTNRMLAPLRPSDDAFVIDTTHLKIGEILEQAIGVVRGGLVYKACCA